MAQTAVGVIGAAAGLSEVNCAVVLSASVLSGIVSLLTSIAGIPEEKTTEVYFCNGDAEEIKDEEVDG